MHGLNLVRMVLAGALTLGLLGTVPIGVVGDGWAQEPSAKTKTLLRGKVTVVGTTTIRIDGTDYPLDQKVTITDLLGQRRSLKEVKPGQEVHFHIEKGRIDQILLDLPS